MSMMMSDLAPVPHGGNLGQMIANPSPVPHDGNPGQHDCQSLSVPHDGISDDTHVSSPPLNIGDHQYEAATAVTSVHAASATASSVVDANNVHVAVDGHTAPNGIPPATNVSPPDTSYASKLAPRTSAAGYQYEPGTPAALKFKHPRQLCLDFMHAPGPPGRRAPQQDMLYAQISDKIDTGDISSVFLDPAKKRCLINFKTIDNVERYLNTSFTWTIGDTQFTNKLQYSGTEETKLLLNYVFAETPVDSIKRQFNSSPEVLDARCHRHCPPNMPFPSGKVFINVKHKPGWTPPAFIQLEVEWERISYMVLRAGKDPLSTALHPADNSSVERDVQPPEQPTSPIARRTRASMPLVGMVGDSLLHHVHERKELRTQLGGTRRETCTTCPGGTLGTIDHRLGSSSELPDVQHVFVLAGTINCTDEISSATKTELANLKQTVRERYPSATVHPIAIPPLLKPGMTPAPVMQAIHSRNRSHNDGDFVKHTQNRLALNMLIQQFFNKEPIDLEVDELNPAHYHDNIHLSNEFWKTIGIPKLLKAIEQS